jgi:uncharacterized membrane protein (DUF106 family)
MNILLKILTPVVMVIVAAILVGLSVMCVILSLIDFTNEKEM